MLRSRREGSAAWASAFCALLWAGSCVPGGLSGVPAAALPISTGTLPNPGWTRSARIGWLSGSCAQPQGLSQLIRLAAEAPPAPCRYRIDATGKRPTGDRRSRQGALPLLRRFSFFQPARLAIDVCICAVLEGFGLYDCTRRLHLGFPAFASAGSTPCAPVFSVHGRGHALPPGDTSGEAAKTDIHMVNGGATITALPVSQRRYCDHARDPPTTTQFRVVHHRPQRIGHLSASFETASADSSRLLWYSKTSVRTDLTPSYPTP